MALFPPPIQPFRRTHIRDGLLINAQIWQDSHAYHRQRQNFHYQSLYQPGIIAGLGVAVVPAPRQLSVEYRDERWLQVKPGIAIDAQGNPIIVPEAQFFHIQSQPTPTQGPQLIYLVANYVDPEDLHGASEQDYGTETFRLVEKTTLELSDVELCRILLSPGTTKISAPVDVFRPQVNQLDLRDRLIACPKAQGEVSIAFGVTPQLKSSQEQGKTTVETQIQEGLSQLARALNVQSLPLQASPTVSRLNLQSLTANELLQTHADLVYLSRQQLLQLNRSVIEALRTHLQQGGLVVVTVDFAEERHLQELISIRQELGRAIRDLEQQESWISSEQGDIESSQAETRQRLAVEREAVEIGITRQFEAIAASLQSVGSQLHNPIHGSGQLHRQHPLRQYPFLFSQLPTLQDQAIQVRQWDGLVLLIGNLALHCGLDEALERPRETLRSAQEFGINLLHFAWQRRQMLQQLLPWEPSGNPDPVPALNPSLTQRINSVNPINPIH